MRIVGSRCASAAIVGAIPAKSRSPLARPANFVVGSSTTAITSSRIRGGPPRAAGKSVVARKHPALPRDPLHEAERPVADRRKVERRAAHVGPRHVAQEVFRQDRQFAQHQRKAGRRGGETQHGGRIVGRVHRIERARSPARA